MPKQKPSTLATTNFMHEMVPTMIKLMQIKCLKLALIPIDGVNITHAEAIWILGTFRTSIIVND